MNRQKPSYLAELVVKASGQLSHSALSAVASALRRGDLALSSTSVEINLNPDMSPPEAQHTAELFRSLKGHAEEKEVAAAIEATALMKASNSERNANVELTWTGPKTQDRSMRTHFDVVREMIAGMKSSGEILVVGYSLTAVSGSPMYEVIRLLSSRSRRIGQIRFVLHEDDGDENLTQVLSGWGVLDVKPEIFTWRPREGAIYTKMHAKALVVDRSQAPITSANLTHHGMKENIELGARIEGDAAGSVAEHFDALIAEDILTRWAPN